MGDLIDRGGLVADHGKASGPHLSRMAQREEARLTYNGPKPQKVTS